MRTAVWIAAIGASSCIVGDDDERCGENQKYFEGTGLMAPTRCECIEGTVPDPKGYDCKRCGKNETAQGGMCVCEAGYARAGEGEPCEQASIGQSCEGQSDCQAPFPYCAEDGEESYCTSADCMATSCPTGFACEEGATKFCKKLPAGLGKACTSNDECTGAGMVCDMMVSHACILTGCAGGDTKCPGFYGCCDLSMFVPDFSICVAPAELAADGACAFGKRVMP